MDEETKQELLKHLPYVLSHEDVGPWLADCYVDGQFFDNIHEYYAEVTERIVEKLAERMKKT